MKLQDFGSKWIKMSLHSWERESQSHSDAEGPRHSWESDGNEDDLECDWNNFDSDDEDTMSPGMEFVNFMLSLLFFSKMSAKNWILIMWFAGAAGIGEAKKYGLRPGQSSGNYSKKVRQVMGWNDRRRFYRLHCPSQGKHDIVRSETEISTIPGHEQMAEDFKDNKEEILDRLETLKIIEGGLPPQYEDHPVVRAADPGEPVIPISIYMDGVPYSNSDGVLGFWIVNHLNDHRYFLSGLRKRIVCKCGCRGWCTFFRFFEWLNWQLVSLGKGKHPLKRDDDRLWIESDIARSDLEGQSLEFRAACFYLIGDWAEYAGPIGLPTWNDVIRACYECNAWGPRMYEMGRSIDHLPWITNSEDDYYDACDQCEVKVELRKRSGDKEAIKMILRYDKRKTGCHGRCLVSDIIVNGIQLRKGDRLEPSPNLRDVGGFEELKEPVIVTFWRSSEESLTRHRNPIFNREIGMSPKRCLMVDLLHGFFLGVLNTWCHRVIWIMMEKGAYGDVGNEHENLEVSVMVIRANLMKFYDETFRKNGEETLTRVSDLTKGMLNQHWDKHVKTKGAETWGFALFLKDELEKRGTMMGADRDRLLNAGEQLIAIATHWKSYLWKIPEHVSKEIEHRYLIHMELMKPYDSFTPKHHAMIHPIVDTMTKGNPNMIAAWYGESLNKNLKENCRYASQISFEETILIKMQEVLKIKRTEHHKRKRDW